jgi:GNAT superfamily N-acetyltransferase
MRQPPFSDDTPVRVRLATPDDVERIAQLCGHLGYPSTGAQIKRRLAQLLAEDGHAVSVAHQADAQLQGWVHVYRCYLLHADAEAQIGALVVDAAARRAGTGQRLLQAAEQWARERQCGVICLRSHVARHDAHQFYERMGYARATSSVFRKRL